MKLVANANGFWGIEEGSLDPILFNPLLAHKKLIDSSQEIGIGLSGCLCSKKDNLITSQGSKYEWQELIPQVKVASNFREDHPGDWIRYYTPTNLEYELKANLLYPVCYSSGMIESVLMEVLIYLSIALKNLNL
ncbi:hypothetical protein M9H77_05949 [Catharanthus roseus]|uniref:Uncharacterized protein n=1 Tax=Catharanthus roseus TaxID=4058 RepID=A0ACC0BQV0_CATRO|nr:hypothetical protein M9H77_05949 [Catharanthus roseus]